MLGDNLDPKGCSDKGSVKGRFGARGGGAACRFWSGRGRNRFTWLTDDRHPEVRGEAAFLARLSEQSEDWLRLRDEASGELCVAGDFNQDLLSEGHYYGSGGGRTALRDAFHKCGLDCLTGGKDDPLAGHAGLASVDHIAITGLRAVGERRSTVWPAPGTLNRTLLSDHYGVWAEVVQV